MYKTIAEDAENALKAAKNAFPQFSTMMFLQTVKIENATINSGRSTNCKEAIVLYIGIGNMFADLWLGLTNWLYVDVKPKSQKQRVENKPDVDWKVILYHGEEKGSIPRPSITNA